MGNQFGRDQNRFQHQDRDWDRDDNRNVWQSRDDRDEDGGWGRHRQDEGWRNRGMDHDDERRFGESSGAGGQGQRGYGQGIYGESGSGGQNRNERSGYGSDRWQSSAGSGGRDYGSSDRYGQGGSSGGYGQGSSGGYGQGGSSGGYGRGSSGSYGQGSSGYGRGSGSYGQSSGGYGQGSSGSIGASAGYGAYHGLGGGDAGYGQGSGGYSSAGLGRDRLGSQRDQGFRGRDYGGGGFAGRGPKGYTRTDERVREDVCDRLSQDDEVDASDISVRVENGEVTLEGTTETRRQKHRAEEIAADVAGVSDVHNNVRVRKSMLSELKDKVTGDDEPIGGHAGSGTKDTANDLNRQSH